MFEEFEVYVEEESKDDKEKGEVRAAEKGNFKAHYKAKRT